MFIILNGPLGIGKSTLAEALTESVDGCVMLSGDGLLAVNPPPRDELEHLHSTIAVLVSHHLASGYRHFVIEHFWGAPAELADLRDRLAGIAPGEAIRCFLLTLPAEENLARIERRQRARAIDERDFELRTFAEERAIVNSSSGLGEPFDASAAPAELVAALCQRLGLA